MAACGLETGKIYLWTVNTPQRWSALAPDFAEVEENVEYIEHEDEFDIHPISVIQQRRLDLEDEDVDVVGLVGSSTTIVEAATSSSSSSSSSVDKDHSMMKSQPRSSKRNPLVDDNRHTNNNNVVNDNDDDIPFRMPVLLDISESESEEEVVPVGPGTMRRKSPGQGKEWLVDATTSVTLDDHIHAGGNNGNGDGMGIGRSSGTPTTASAASGPEIAQGNVGIKKSKRRRG